MIKLSDSIILASAKLHSRRILLMFSVLISSVLFGVLFAGSFIVSGINTSMETFNAEGHHGQYLVKASPIIPQSVYTNNANLDVQTIKELKKLNDEYVAREKAESKELGVVFDESNVEPALKPSPFANSNLPSDMQYMVNYNSPVFNEYIRSKLVTYASEAKNTRSGLAKVAKRYSYKNIYPIENAQITFSNTVFLKGDMEDLDYLLKPANPSTSGATAYGYLVNSVKNSDYRLLNNDLLRSWVLPVNGKRQDNTSHVPVIITTKEAIDLFEGKLNISAPPTDSQKKIQWMKNLQDKINGETYSSCFRNDSDRALISQAIKDLSAIKANSGNPNYITPSLIYDLPSEPCGSLTIKTDTRSDLEKQNTQKQIDVQKRLGTYVEPTRKLINFQIVGVMDINESFSSSPKNIQEFANSLFANTIDSGALIPKNIYDSSTAKTLYDDVLFPHNGATSSFSSANDASHSLGPNIISFNDLSSARDFIRNEGCSEQQPDCNRLFTLDPYGSNYLLLEEMQVQAKKVINIALPLVVFLAGIILFFTMTRIIIDSRNETAVFRALGAKRSDIVSIYTVYSVIVAISILITSLFAGLAISLVVQYLYGDSFTQQATIAYGIFNSSLEFSFIGIDYPLLCIIGLSCIITCLLATILPLARNVKRNPISDMRQS